MKDAAGKTMSWPLVITKMTIQDYPGMTMSDLKAKIAADDGELERAARRLIKTGDVRRDEAGRHWPVTIHTWENP